MWLKHSFELPFVGKRQQGFILSVVLTKHFKFYAQNECVCVCMGVCVCVGVCVWVCGCVSRKTKDRADGMREKSAHSPRRDSNLYLWDTRPRCFRLHHGGKAASRQSKRTL